MPSIKDLKKSITSVKNTQQTTRAMKMVSAAKLRRAQEAITNQRPYARRIGELIQVVSGLEGAQVDSPLVQKESDTANEAGKRLLVIVVTSDRGLCGGFNSNVIKKAQRWIKAEEGKYASIELGFVGRKGYEFFKTRRTSLGPYYSELSGKVSFAKAKKLSDSLIALYIEGKFDEIKFIYNEFKNAVTQQTVVQDFLPLKPQTQEATTGGAPSADIYFARPAPAQLLKTLIEKNFTTQAFRVLLESQAGEHGARMSAMENATKNAGEMIRKLTLQYNKQRQAGITKELLEIISGSESQKG